MGGVSAALRFRSKKKKKSLEPEIPKSLISTKPIPICVLGQQKVGKSSLILKYYMGTYFENFESSGESKFTKLVELKGKNEQLVIHDVNGFENLQPDEVDELIRACEGIVLAYSILSPSSFKLVLKMFDRIMEVTQRDRTFPIVICATQVDNEFKRCIPKSDGEKLAEELDAGFYETSAALDLNIREPFANLGLRAIERRERQALEAKGQKTNSNNVVDGGKTKDKKEKKEKKTESTVQKEEI